MPDFHIGELDWLHDCHRRGLRIYAQGALLRTRLDFTLEHWNLYYGSAYILGGEDGLVPGLERSRNLLDCRTF